MNENIIDSNLLKQDIYQYGMYDEYLDNIYKNLFFSDKKSLSIKLFKLNLDVSRVYEFETSMADSKMKEKNKYDVYNYVPTIESNSLTYQTTNQLEKGGFKISTAGTITIIVLEEPLPGDIFHYYNNDTELFKVTSVNFVRNAHNKLKIYQLNYETVNLKASSMDDMIINKEYFYITEFEFFFESYEWENYVNIINNKDQYLKDFTKFYDSVSCKYESIDNSDELNFKVNNILKFLNITIPSFQTKYQEHKIKYNQYETVDKLTDDECYIDNDTTIILPEDANDPTDEKYVYNRRLNQRQIELNFKVKQLYDWYEQLINHKKQRKDEISWEQQ